MTATLLREVFGDKEASLRATATARQANEEVQRLTQQYIRMANEALQSATPAGKSAGAQTAPKKS